MVKQPTVQIPYVRWRGGKPRSQHGPRLRALGFADADLKTDAGAWFTYEQAVAWSIAHTEQIETVKASGQKLKLPRAAARTTIADLLRDFQNSETFKLKRELGGYSDETRADYRAKIAALLYRPETRKERLARERAGGERPPEPFAQSMVKAIGKPEVRAFYDYLARVRGLTMARGAIMVLSKAFAWASTDTRWRLDANPCHKLDLPIPPPRIRIASDAEFAALIWAADELALPEVGDACFLGLFTGQRESDVLHLVDTDSAAGRRRFKQSKTGAIVSIRETPQLTARLAAAADRRRRMDNTIVDTTVVIHAATGRRFVRSTFQHLYAAVRRKAAERAPSLLGTLGAGAILPLNFQDLRDTAVTWLARAGCTVPEIASLTGHSPGSIYAILKHYLALDEHLADSAAAKLVAWLEAEGMQV